MKANCCDAAGLTADLYFCVIELKYERPMQREVEQLVLAVAADQIRVSDEQLLSLP